MKAFEDPEHKGNSSEYHTGYTCIEIGCDAPAGTLWGKHWCFKHNVERIKKIDSQFETLLSGFSERESQ